MRFCILAPSSTDVTNLRNVDFPFRLSSLWLFFAALPALPAPPPPYRNYITRVGYNYKPHAFKNKEALDGILKGKCLINQSRFVLPDEAIELLSLGLNFIPSSTFSRMHLDMLAEQSSRFKRSINLSLHFNKAKKAGAAADGPPSSLRGWLASYVPSTWNPPAQSWAGDPTIDLDSCATRQENVIRGPTTPPALMAALRQLESRPDLSVLKSDKGRNIVVWATEDYDREALRQLTDTTCYEELTEPECRARLRGVAGQCYFLADNLHDLGHISESEFGAMKAAKPDCSVIYFLPKTHKPAQPVSKTFAGRPIVATFTNVVHLLDKYITAVTAVLLHLIPGSLKDTGDLLDRLPKDPLPATAGIVTMDVVGLYPSIPWEAGFDATVAFYADKLAYLAQHARDNSLRPPPSARLFRAILELVLRNSIISFKNRRFFHQRLGTAMGMCISVFFANCYMYSITRIVIDNPPDWLILMLRFIDDLILLVKFYDEALVDGLVARISNAAIKYDKVPPQPDQPFLDLSFNINPVSHLIETSPYWKPTASGSYLHPASNHPAHVIKSIPYAQYLRLLRNSSTIPIFEKAAARLKSEFLKVGYKRKLLDASYAKAMATATSPNAGRKINDNNSTTFRLILPFNRNTNWRTKQRALAAQYAKVVSHYEEPSVSANADHAALLRSRRPVIVSSNETAIGAHFSKYVKIPRADRAVSDAGRNQES